MLRTLLFVGIASAFYSYLKTDTRLLKRTLLAFVIMTAVTMAFSLLAMTVLPEIYWFTKLKGWLSTPVMTKLKGFSALVIFMVPALILAGVLYSRSWKIVCILIFFSLISAWPENS